MLTPATGDGSTYALAVCVPGVVPAAFDALADSVLAPSASPADSVSA